MTDRDRLARALRTATLVALAAGFAAQAGGCRRDGTAADPGTTDAALADAAVPDAAGPDAHADAGEPDAIATDAAGPDADADAGAPDLATGDPGPDVPPAQQPVPADFLGMCPMDGHPTPAQWDQLAAWGVKLVRQGFFWDGVGSADGTFDFTWPDEYVGEAEKRGMGVLITLDYDCSWIHAEGDPRPAIPPEALDAWLAYVRAVATRYRDRAWGFEVWNEPNLGIFWKGTQADFVTLAKATVAAVHESAPGVPVAVAGFSLMPLEWLDAMHAEGIVAAADAISFHPYWVDAEGALQMVGLAREWMAQNGLDKPLWLTEYGWPSGGTYPTATDLDGQAERLVRFQAGLATAGVRASWWYASRDSRDPEEVDDPADSEAFFGVSYPTAGDKPSGRAFAVLAGLLPGATPDASVAAPFAADGKLDARGFVRPDGTTAVVVTNRTGSPVVLSLPAGHVALWPQAPDPAVATVGQVAVAADRSAILAGPVPAGNR
jgi:hypothetical protein